MWLPVEAMHNYEESIPTIKWTKQTRDSEVGRVKEEILFSYEKFNTSTILYYPSCGSVIYGCDDSDL